MTHILNFLKSKKTLNNIINESKVIHCANDETFAFFAYYNYLKNSFPL